MKYFYLFLILLVSISCSSSEKVLDDAADSIRKQYEEEGTSVLSSSQFENLRTQLSDAYAYRENEIPEAFKQVRVEQKVEKNIYQGYRIQIYSGQDVSEADTIAHHFKAWADTTISSYNPDTYVFFRTPYYRVHIGDFHERERAIRFSNLVKRQFRDAWVVYDRVNPAKVPADTTLIQLQ
jgi:hypothetical protein